MPIDTEAAAGAVAGPAVAREHEELARAEGVDLGLRGDFQRLGGFGGGVCPEREGDDEFLLVFRFLGVADIVHQQPRLFPVGIVGPSLLVERALHECVQRLPIIADRQAF